MNAPARPVALITGASGGIGRELARLFATDGHDLIVTARSRDLLETLAAELEAAVDGCTVTVVTADLSATGGADDLLAQVAAAGHDVAVLINNAGFGVLSPFIAQDRALLDQMLALNVAVPQQLTHALLPGMIARGGGRICNIASVAGITPGPYFAAYHASKSYLVALSLALAEELRGTGVTVTCVCPGVTATGFQARAELVESRVQDMITMDAETVARQAHRATMRGRTLLVNGVRNKVQTVALRAMPIRWSTRIAGRALRGAMR